MSPADQIDMTPLPRAQALLDEAKAAAPSGEMADRLWAMNHELVKAGLGLVLEGVQMQTALHEEWKRHRY